MNLLVEPAAHLDFLVGLLPGHTLNSLGDARAALFCLDSGSAEELERLHQFCRIRPTTAVIVVAPELSGAALAGLRAKVKQNGAQEALTRAELPVHFPRALEYALERASLLGELDSWRHSEDVADAANKRASQVLAMVSHEIRGRMTVINFMSTLAVDARTKEERRSECLRVLKESSESLQSLLNDLLDHAKLLEGELTLSPIDFNLRNLLENTVSGFRILAESKGVEVRVEVSSVVPDSMIGDPGRLRQVLVNLLSNALKFTSQGSVILRVEPGVRFSVSDTGVGIPKHLHERVFKPYTQAEHSTARKYGGTGLGLTIASRLVELMGGKLELDSEPGRGTTFFFTAQLEPHPTEHPSLIEQVDLAGLPVLVVDSHAHSQRHSLRALTEAGVEVVAVDDGHRALDQLRERHFRVALVDMVLPDGDGFQLAEEIRALGGDTRVVLLTSAGQRGDAARCLELRVAGYLTRPVEPQDLLDAMRLVEAGSRTLVTRHTLREARECS